MKRLGTKGFIALALLGTSIVALVVGLAVRSTPEAPSVPQPSKEALARTKLQEALRDASLLDLIRNARIAARKGDTVTHGAMVSGLRREPARAKSLIHSEISKSYDTADISILNRMITELP